MISDELKWFSVFYYYNLFFGKNIIHRILKTIASGTEISNVTMLANPSVVDVLLEERKKMDVEVG